MRLDSSLILAGFLAILAASAILVVHSQETKNEQSIEMVLKTDKEVYRSGETMLVSAELSEQIGNVTVSVRGIKDSRGNYRVEQDYQIPADSLQDQVNFSFTMPSCYGCAGVSPGDYEIYAEILSGSQQVANATRVVRLEK